MAGNMEMEPADDVSPDDAAGEGPGRRTCGAGAWRKETFEPEWLKKRRAVLARTPPPIDAPVVTTPAAEPEKPFRMRDADPSELPEDVEARDLCSFGHGTGRRYSVNVRLEALQYFERGWGYKATAGFLHLPYYTVREWKRLFQQGKFTREKLLQQLEESADLFDAEPRVNYPVDRG